MGSREQTRLRQIQSWLQSFSVGHGSPIVLVSLWKHLEGSRFPTETMALPFANGLSRPWGTTLGAPPFSLPSSFPLPALPFPTAPPPSPLPFPSPLLSPLPLPTPLPLPLSSPPRPPLRPRPPSNPPSSSPAGEEEIFDAFVEISSGTIGRISKHGQPAGVLRHSRDSLNLSVYGEIWRKTTRTAAYLQISQQLVNCNLVPSPQVYNTYAAVAASEASELFTDDVKTTRGRNSTTNNVMTQSRLTLSPTNASTQSGATSINRPSVVSVSDTNRLIRCSE